MQGGGTYTIVETEEKRRERNDLTDDPGDRIFGRTYFAGESYVQVKSLYALDMFSSFVWAATKTMTDEVKGGAEIRPIEGRTREDWIYFTLSSNHLSKMVRDIESTGLGGLDDIYLSIIPPLSAENKLPHADGLIRLVQAEAIRYEYLGHENADFEPRWWLFKQTERFPKAAAIEAMAALMELWRLVDLDQNDETQLFKAGLAAKLLIDAGANIEARKKGGRTPLHMSTYSFDRYSPYRARLLLEAGADKESRSDSGETPMHNAAHVGNVSCVKLLIEAGADVNARDHTDSTPLHEAIATNEISSKILRVLIEAGADINARNDTGETPLHYCTGWYYDDDNIKRPTCIPASVNIEEKTTLGMTPLHYACSRASHATDSSTTNYLDPGWRGHRSQGR